MSADRDTVTRDFHDFTVGKKSREIARLRAEVSDLTAAIAAARAALDGEREACDRWRRHWDRFGYSATLAPNACVMDSIIAHDQRRAAEAKASRGGEGGA